MKTQVLLIFLFVCIFLISGCGQKNSRAKFQKIASNVEMDYLDKANIYDFEMYLPKGYIEYKPDSKKYKKTKVILPSGREKEVKSPYAMPNYKKNELEECAENIDKNIINKPAFNDFLKDTKIFINYEKKSVLYVMPMCKAAIGGTAGTGAELAARYNKSVDSNANFFINSMKEKVKKDGASVKEYNLSSDEKKVDIKFFNAKLKQKEGLIAFMDVAAIKMSKVNAVIIFCQQDEKTYDDIAAILLSIKPLY